MKTTEEGAGSTGYDAHNKNVKGRKRHLLVDTLGLPHSIYVTPADVQDRVGARLLLSQDWDRWGPARRRSGQTARTAARNWPSGARSREGGS
jgi:hypothetical protein